MDLNQIVDTKLELLRNLQNLKVRLLSRPHSQGLLLKFAKEWKELTQAAKRVAHQAGAPFSLDRLLAVLHTGLFAISSNRRFMQQASNCGSGSIVALFELYECGCPSFANISQQLRLLFDQETDPGMVYTAVLLVLGQLIDRSFYGLVAQRIKQLDKHEFVLPKFDLPCCRIKIQCKSGVKLEFDILQRKLGNAGFEKEQVKDSNQKLPLMMQAKGERIQTERVYSKCKKLVKERVRSYQKMEIAAHIKIKTEPDVEPKPSSKMAGLNRQRGNTLNYGKVGSVASRLSTLEQRRVKRLTEELNERNREIRKTIRQSSQRITSRSIHQRY